MPPITLVTSTLTKFEKSRAQGTLVVPKWESSAFWPILFPQGHPAWYVKFVLEYPSDKKVFEQGNNKNSLIGSKHMKSSALVLVLDSR